MLTRKPKYTLNMGEGALIAEFYVNDKKLDYKNNYLRIYAPNGVFDLKVVGETYMRLLGAMLNENVREIELFSTYMWIITSGFYGDEQFVRDIVKAVEDKEDRLLAKGAEQAIAVTDTEEEMNQALMDDIVADLSKSKEELARDREEMREIAKELFNQKEDTKE